MAVLASGSSATARLVSGVWSGRWFAVLAVSQLTLAKRSLGTPSALALCCARVYLIHSLKRRKLILIRRRGIYVEIVGTVLWAAHSSFCLHVLTPSPAVAIWRQFGDPVSERDAI